MSGHGFIGDTDRLLEDVTDRQVRNEREDTWGEMPGEIVSFDTASQTATVRPLWKKPLNGVATALPELLEVPVRFPRVGGFILTSRVRAGDKVTLRPQMRNTEAYHGEGGPFEARDARSFSLSDMEAYLDGGESLSQPIGEFNADEMEMRSEDASMKVQIGDDRIRMFSADGKLRTVIRPDKKLVQLKAGEGASAMHFTLDYENGVFIKSSHPMIVGDDPNPQD